MWVIALLGAINLALSFAQYFLPIPGLELTPAAMVLIARSGENIVIGAIVMTLTYMVPQPRRFAFIWLHLPSALLCGWLALHIEGPLLPVLAYGLVSLGPGLVLGLMSTNYALFIIVNTALNMAVVRFATMF
jgi:hypothetical protein